MSSRRLILASASPARLRLLVDAGFSPEVRVSGIDEDAVEADSVDALVVTLAEAKAAAVAAGADLDDALVIGCDSLFEIDGQGWGKPVTPDAARSRIRAMQGRSGLLHTGHCVIDVSTGRRAAAVRSTVVTFAPMTDREVDAYVATGEPLEVAGSFTLDGRASVFVESIEGDPSNVIGLSLPLLRTLLAELEVGVMELWT